MVSDDVVGECGRQMCRWSDRSRHENDMEPYTSQRPHFTGDGHTKPILTEVKDQVLRGLGIVGE